MLPVKVIEDAKRMLDEGQLSQRKIAEVLGVSRATVSNISSGKRGIYGEGGKQRSTPARCPGCGAVVQLPCILCRARAYKNRQALLKARQDIRTKRVA